MQQVPPDIPDAVVEDFIASHEGGGSLEEIADALGLTRQRVWQILSRALKKLKRACQERDIQPADFPSRETSWDRLESF